MIKPRVFLGVAFLMNTLATTAHAQVLPDPIFRGSPVRSFYDRGIIASVVQVDGRGEALKITGTIAAFADLVTGRNTVKDQVGRANPLIRVGPNALPPKGRCHWAAAEISDLEKCFAGNPNILSDNDIETVEVAIDAENLKEFRLFISRHKKIKDLYASCRRHEASKTPLSCEVTFEDGGLLHSVTAGPTAPQKLPELRCFALLARAIVWPAGPFNF